MNVHTADQPTDNQPYPPPPAGYAPYPAGNAPAGYAPYPAGNAPPGYAPYPPGYVSAGYDPQPMMQQQMRMQNVTFIGQPTLCAHLNRRSVATQMGCIVAICFFPLGLIFCMLTMESECRNCRARLPR